MSLPAVEQLNSWCKQHQIKLFFHAISRHSPRLVNDGFLVLDASTLKLAADIRSTLKADEWHALVDTERKGLGEVMHYQVVRYSDMLALRQQGKMPTGLAATLLPLSKASNHFLLQKRSASSHLFPGFLSLLGGGFNPSFDGLVRPEQAGDVSDLLGDDNNPRLTARREVFEESGLHIEIPEQTLVTITQETDNGAMQINYLAVPADFSGAKADEAEGLLVEIPVPSLEQIAGLALFTDLAKANMAAWLIAASVR